MVEAMGSDGIVEALIQGAFDAVLLLAPEPTGDGTEMDYRVLALNAGALTLLGLEGHHAQGRLLGEALPGFPSSSVAAALAQAWAARAPMQAEGAFGAGHGGASHAVHIHPAGPGLLLTCRPSGVRVSPEEKFRSLLESAPDAMVIVDHGSRIVLVNAQAERLFGFDRAELLGQPIEMLVPERYRRGHVAHRDQYQGGPKVRPMGAGLDLFGKRKDGSEFPVEISLSPLETEEGKLVASSIRDITGRKLVEQELKEKNAELEKASQAKDRFLATMSHELRTPLNAILGFTGVLLMGLPGPLNAQQESQLRTVESSAKHLLSLINDLLDLARIQSGKLVLDLQPVDLNQLLQELGAALRPIADGKGLTLVVDLPPPGTLILTDRRALHQIMLNLTNNALKFTKAGGVHVGLARSGQGLDLWVRDTGVGIAPEFQAKLFVAFEQASGAGSGGEPGTGLGLYLSQLLAGLLGGRLECASAPGEGSTFTLCLAGEGLWPAS